MTDLTPDDILRVARAVRPEWTDDMGYWVVEPNGAAEFRMHHSGNGGFDTLNSNADAFKVLAWLANQSSYFELESFREERTLTVYPMVDPDNYSRFPLDDTEAGLRRAITQAAARAA